MNIKWYLYSDVDMYECGIRDMVVAKRYIMERIPREADLRPHLVHTEATVLFIHGATERVYEVCQSVSAVYPHVYIILIVPEAMKGIRKAMRAGASDILSESCRQQELENAIEQAEQYMLQRLQNETAYAPVLEKRNGTIISVCSMRGGVGCTALAVNIATGFLAKGKKVLIIDANLQFGNAALYCNLKPKRTIYEWIKEAYGREGATIDPYITSNSEGVSLLAAPARPEFFEIITEDHIQAVLLECRKLFDVIIIDTSAYLSEIHISCLEQSQYILLVITNDLPSLRSSSLYLETLASLQLREKVKIIMNRDAKEKLLSIRKIEELLGESVYSSVPEHKVVRQSICTGVPFMLAHPRTPPGRAVWRLIDKLAGGETEQKPSKKQRKRWSVSFSWRR